MASSASNPPGLYGVMAAPPPTPAALALPSGSHLSTSGTADLLSSLLRRLPPTLSLPTRRHPPAPTTTTPLPSLSFGGEWGSGDFLASLSAASQLGFFELSGHGIPIELAGAAETDSLTLFDLPDDQKGTCLPKNWPLGYEPGYEDESRDSFCLESKCSSESVVSTSLPLTSLRKFTREMELVGLKVVEWLSSHAGFLNPNGDNPARLSSFMWVSRALVQDNGGRGWDMSGGFYPYVVGLSYQIRRGQKYTLLADSGRVSVTPEAGSIMVTIGDIAQVWSNGKLKKVRGRPVPVPSYESKTEPAEVPVGTTTTMSLLITLPLDSIVSPLPTVPGRKTSSGTERGGGDHDASEEEMVFSSFPFEDYARRIYNERLSYKDPLDRYRI